jgi:hypothetical protein
LPARAADSGRRHIHRAVAFSECVDAGLGVATATGHAAEAAVSAAAAVGRVVTHGTSDARADRDVVAVPRGDHMQIGASYPARPAVFTAAPVRGDPADSTVDEREAAGIVGHVGHDLGRRRIDHGPRWRPRARTGSGVEQDRQRSRALDCGELAACFAAPAAGRVTALRMLLERERSERRAIDYIDE